MYGPSWTPTADEVSAMGRIVKTRGEGVTKYYWYPGEKAVVWWSWHWSRC
jgi:hypothetical protein